MQVVEVKAGGPAEVFIKGEECVGFDAAEDVAEFLFDAVDGVIEVTAVDAEAAAAEAPIATEEEIEAEDVVLKRSEIAAADEAEIGHVFFFFTAPHVTAAAIAAALEGGGGDVDGFFGAILEAGEADAEDVAEDAFAGSNSALAGAAEAGTGARRAAVIGESEGV